jgi:hypothetical protein
LVVGRDVRLYTGDAIASRALVVVLIAFLYGLVAGCAGPMHGPAAAVLCLPFAGLNAFAVYSLLRLATGGHDLSALGRLHTYYTACMVFGNGLLLIVCFYVRVLAR